MISQIKSLEKLIHELTKLPGIGEKSAQRLAFYILKSGSEYNQSLQKALGEVLENVRFCDVCFALTDNVDLCKICTHPSRTQEQICIVEEPMDIFKIENSGVYSGVYHVLQGTISPLEGIHPENLKIPQLLERIDRGEKGMAPKCREVIVALDADLEGDTTSLYLAKVLRKYNIQLTRLAHGVPFGTDIDYIDRRTLGHALEHRVEI